MAPTLSVSTNIAPSLDRDDVQFRFKTHVHEFICPASPDRAQLGRSSVFAGGGITNCPDWQVELSQLVNTRISELSGGKLPLGEEKVLSILNPRRENFPINDPTASRAQVTWEHNYLNQSTAISFWNPKNTEGQITLFETGRWMMSAKPMFLGIEPGFARTQELLAHIQSARPDYQVSDTLEQHADNIARWALGMGRVDSCTLSQPIRERTMYLAGGIKNCPDWQQEVSSLLSGTDVNIDNPRIPNFTPQKSSEEFRALVRRNRLALDSSESVLMWFPKDHLTPIALLELGSLMPSSKPIFIGIEPGYKRQMDVEIQTHLARPEISIVYSLGELAEQVKRYYAMRH